ncbi:MAG TPA: ABC transporter ATP-binding protein [Trebonia sp.]|nr:ABC transporter ATP-binding protein [Trebonia sp.]
MTVTGGQPALKAAGLGFAAGGVSVLRDVDLVVGEGEFLGIIGPNGAGKTTLFNLLSGLLRPSAGSVELAGRDITGLTPARRARLGLGRTFQTSMLLGALPAAENVRLAAQASGGGSGRWWYRPRDSDVTSARARAAIAAVGLSAVAARPASALSHGDKRKLELAILMAGDARVLLLDEPMAGVSSEDVPGLTELIRNLHADGRTVLMVEHHMPVILGLAQQVAVLHHGTLLARGTPGEVMADETVQGAYLGEPL